MGLRNMLLRTGGSSGSNRVAAVIDYDEFVTDTSDPRWQDSLAAAHEHVAAEQERGAAVIDYDEFIADSNDPEWQAALDMAREHVSQLECDGRSPSSRQPHARASL